MKGLYWLLSSQLFRPICLILFRGWFYFPTNSKVKWGSQNQTIIYTGDEAIKPTKWWKIFFVWHNWKKIMVIRMPTESRSKTNNPIYAVAMEIGNGIVVYGELFKRGDYVALRVGPFNGDVMIGKTIDGYPSLEKAEFVGFWKADQPWPLNYPDQKNVNFLN